jgi:Na+-transporting NADH:ubiquinone oxidoreductase subunit C
MAINKESNGYTIGFAILLVVVVGAILASISIGLKEKQTMNGVIKKKINILEALKVESDRTNAETLYSKYILENECIVINNKGEVKEGVKAFDVDVRKEHRDKTLKLENKNFPLFVANNDKGEKTFIIPVVGNGLWGPIWGYVSLASDMRTIYGITFDHQGETPGLGAEIKYESFTKLWLGEKVADESYAFNKIEVVKDGSGSQDLKVDGITGGTITSKGVEEMMNRAMGIYMNYFKKINN